MLDLKFIRENPELVKDGARKKNDKCDIDLILSLDQQRRNILHKVEGLKAERNRVSTEIARKKKAGEAAEDVVAAMREAGEQITSLDGDLRDIDARLQSEMSRVPNVPHEEAPVGDESVNLVIREWGEKLAVDFKVLPHWEIGEKIGIMDLKAAAVVAGSGFYVLTGKGASLQRALINYMLDLHTDDGFTEVCVPYIVTADAMFGTGQLPKLADDMYRIESDDLYLIPTGEVPVTNLYKGKIIPEDQLPIRMVAHTPCFRREAGASGKDTRGMLRVHQFDKVELVKIVHPDESPAELDSLVTQAEKVLQGLKLSYRVSELATGDLSFASARCYDLELWSAGVEKYLEISSVATFGAFQARRMNMRYRRADRKPDFPHTLNGSGVALARLVAAILENYQNADGSVTVPEVLRDYLKGVERIE